MWPDEDSVIQQIPCIVFNTFGFVCFRRFGRFNIQCSEVSLFYCCFFSFCRFSCVYCAGLSLLIASRLIRWIFEIIFKAIPVIVIWIALTEIEWNKMFIFVSFSMWYFFLLNSILFHLLITIRLIRLGSRDIGILIIITKTAIIASLRWRQISAVQCAPTLFT